MQVTGTVNLGDSAIVEVVAQRCWRQMLFGGGRCRGSCLALTFDVDKGTDKVAAPSSGTELSLAWLT